MRSQELVTRPQVEQHRETLPRSLGRRARGLLLEQELAELRKGRAFRRERVEAMLLVGGPGEHHCLGANLARREISVVFRGLLRRLPDLEITGPPEMLRSSFIHGIKRMPCAFTPGGAQ